MVGAVMNTSVSHWLCYLSAGYQQSYVVCESPQKRFFFVAVRSMHIAQRCFKRWAVGHWPVRHRPVRHRSVEDRPYGRLPVGLRQDGRRPVGLRQDGRRPVGLRQDGRRCALRQTVRRESSHCATDFPFSNSLMFL